MTAGVACLTTVTTGFGSFLSCDTGGSLSKTTFSLAGANYTISALLHVKAGGLTSPLDLHFDVGTTIPDTSGLVLQLNGSEYIFSSVDTVGNASRAYVWNNPGGLSWISGEDVFVKLCVNE